MPQEEGGILAHPVNAMQVIGPPRIVVLKVDSSPVSNLQAAWAVSLLCPSISRSNDRQLSNCSGNLTLSFSSMLRGSLIYHVFESGVSAPGSSAALAVLSAVGDRCGRSKWLSPFGILPPGGCCRILSQQNLPLTRIAIVSVGPYLGDSAMFSNRLRRPGRVGEALVPQLRGLSQGPQLPPAQGEADGLVPAFKVGVVSFVHQDVEVGQVSDQEFLLVKGRATLTFGSRICLRVRLFFHSPLFA